MLQIKNISKSYVTGELTQHALKDVSLNFRDQEFVSILGPSGSGKTTLLNIIGGLDQYDDGDLIINNISTRQYKSRDWDSYRNHTIGFIFQSYNLIPHQSLLSNVELALTLSGISKDERIARAKKALEDVGLTPHIYKRPNQLSGGQMQRVAIARALVNNPDILLADEPTGALDSETSVQIMNLLKEVAKDRLVIMVTHNPELSEEYATRTIKLRDGVIISDSNPYVLEHNETPPVSYQNLGNSSMSFFTSLALSFNNLRTKKGRTILTAFAGSIGIIGIAMILSLSNGVNTYIENIQRETMTAYPLVIDSETMDLNSIMANPPRHNQSDDKTEGDDDGVYSDNKDLVITNNLMTSLEENNLTDFKAYLEDKNNPIHEYLGENGIVYSYDVPFEVYVKNSDDELVSMKSDTISSEFMPDQETLPMPTAMMPPMVATAGQHFEALLPGINEELVSDMTKQSYDVLSGHWPENYNEVVLVLNEQNQLPIYLMYALGLIPADEYQDLIELANSNDTFEAQAYHFDYEEFLDKELYLVASSDMYEADGELFKKIGTSQNDLQTLVEDSVQLKISGIIRPIKDSDNATIMGAVGYTTELTDYLINVASDSDIVKAQQDSKDINVLTGLQFAPEDDEAKVEDTINYLSSLGVSEKASIMKEMVAASPEQAAQMASLPETQLAAMFDDYLANPDEEVLLMIYENSISPGSYGDNLAEFGYVSFDAPSSISIYVDTFEDKDGITSVIADYNNSVSEEDKIIYTDFVAMMTASMTTIIDVITYVLVAFVAVSLIVSSIMIGIITYISVVERTKEIGILRAMGASKQNISQVFNAETFIIGTLSGTLGIAVTLLLLIPINSIVQTLLDDTSVQAALPVPAAIILIILSVCLTLIGGFIPAKKAALKDPVTALRSE